MRSVKILFYQNIQHIGLNLCSKFQVSLRLGRPIIINIFLNLEFPLLLKFYVFIKQVKLLKHVIKFEHGLCW